MVQLFGEIKTKALLCPLILLSFGCFKNAAILYSSYESYADCRLITEQQFYPLFLRQETFLSDFSSF